MFLFTFVLLVSSAFAGGGHGDCQFDSTSLSSARAGLVGVNAGGSVLFAGGYSMKNGKKTYYDTIDMFNYTDILNPVSNDNMVLPEAREGLTATAVGTAVAFTGGQDEDGHGTNTVWIYNTASDSWEKVAIPNDVVGYGQSSIQQATDMEVFLAGGYYFEDMENFDKTKPAVEGDYTYSAIVAMYDISGAEWNIQAMTRARAELAAVELGDYAFLAGGVNSNGIQGLVERVHLGQEEQVSVVGSLAERRRGLAGAATSWGGQELLFFAGGFTSEGASSTVEIFNVTSDYTPQTFGTFNLSEARGSITAATIDDIVIFGPGVDAKGNAVGSVDVYNVTDHTYFNYTLSEARSGAAVVSMPPDTFYVAGGLDSSGSVSATCDLLDCVNTFPDPSPTRQPTPAPTPVPWPSCKVNPNWNPESDGCSNGDLWCQYQNEFSYCKWWSGSGGAKYPLCWKTEELCSCQCGPPPESQYHDMHQAKLNGTWAEEKLKMVHPTFGNLVEV